MNIADYITKIDDFTRCSDECYAHLLNNEDAKETLREHTEKCQKYWTEIINNANINSIFEKFEAIYLDDFSDTALSLFRRLVANVVTAHDAGKINPLFQKVKMHNLWHSEYEPHKNIGGQHSILSAAIYVSHYTELIKDKEKHGTITDSEVEVLINLMYICAYVISRHHSNLCDFLEFVANFEDDSADENAYTTKTGVLAMEWLEKWNTEVEDKPVSDPITIVKYVRREVKKRNKNDKKRIVYLYGMTKLLFSLLVAADYYATTEFTTGMQMTDFGSLDEINTLYEIYNQTDIQKSIRDYEKNVYPMDSASLKQDTEINHLRTELFLDAEKELKKNSSKNVFYLEAPTGSGKSNVALNLSFLLMQKNPELRKIFYIYPFNTLVEQNIENIEVVFGNNKNAMAQIAVVNSLVEYKDTKEDCNWNRILLDRQFLNYPITLSTHVTLFQTLFGAARADAFAFHQIAHSVIVLDEIQSYRQSLWNEMAIFLKVFAEMFDVKFIIMSATLPNFDILTDGLTNAVQLITDRKKYFDHPIFADRVTHNFELLKIKMTLNLLVRHIKKHSTPSDHVLVECIKKKSAEELYRLLKRSCHDRQILLITGDSSIQERKNALQKTKGTEGFILVATQALEAGVDLNNINIGYKDISKLDSEAQFEGRINRSGKGIGIIYWYNMDDSRKIYGSDTRVCEENTLLDDEVKFFLTTKNFPEFYEKRILKNLKKAKKRMTDDNIDMFFRDKVGLLNMLQVEDKMQLITDKRRMKNVFIARTIETSDGTIIDGSELWNKYKELLQNSKSFDYAEKKVKMHDIMAQMNTFIYQFSHDAEFEADDQIGDLYYIEDGDAYFDENGVFLRYLFNDNVDLFI